MATIIIITPPPTRPTRPQNEQPRVTVLNVDILEDASDVEVLHAALTELEAEQTEHPGPGNPGNPTE